MERRERGKEDAKEGESKNRLATILQEPRPQSPRPHDIPPEPRELQKFLAFLAWSYDKGFTFFPWCLGKGVSVHGKSCPQQRARFASPLC